MAAIKLYYSPGACSLASHVLLKEINAKFEVIEVGITNGPPADFGLINPKMRVPVLSIGQDTITENPAIFTAISQLAPEKQLLGKSDIEIVRSYEWLNWLSGTLHGQAFGGIVRPHRYVDDPAIYDAIKAKGWETAGECFDKIESELSGLHAVGNSFTAVDVFLYIFYRWARFLGVDMQIKYPKYTKLVAELGKLPSVQGAIEAEGIRSFLPDV